MGRITTDQVYAEIQALGTAVDAETIAANLGVTLEMVIPVLRDGERRDEVHSGRRPDGVRQFALTPSGGDVIEFAETVRRLIDYLDDEEHDPEPWQIANDLNEDLALINRAIRFAVDRSWISVAGDGRVHVTDRGRHKLQGDIDFGRWPSRSRL